MNKIFQIGVVLFPLKKKIPGVLDTIKLVLKHNMQCNPQHVCVKVSPTDFNGAFSQVSIFRMTF